MLLRVSPDAALYRDYLGPAQTDTATADDADWAPVEELIQADAEAASSSLDRAAKRLASEFGFAGTVVQRTVESRNVAEAITDAAASERAIVVMTTHGHSGINRWVLGSVTDRVVRHSDAPVLVVRQSETLSPIAMEQRVETAPGQDFGEAAAQPA